MKRFLDDFPTPWAKAWGEDPLGKDGRGYWQEFAIDGARQRLRWIEAGTFTMGSPLGESGRRDNEILHEVILTQGFWMAETACTQALWHAVMGTSPSERQADPLQPVESVSWDDVQIFLEKVNALMPGLDLGLPTEAQWEYACRADTKSSAASQRKTTAEREGAPERWRPGLDEPEGDRPLSEVSKHCNAWGLHGMLGNGAEWCHDIFGPYPTGAVTDPTGPEAGVERVLRGGNRFVGSATYRPAYRGGHPSSFPLTDYGFRLAKGGHSAIGPVGQPQGEGQRRKQPANIIVSPSGPEIEPLAAVASSLFQWKELIEEVLEREFSTFLVGRSFQEADFPGGVTFPAIVQGCGSIEALSLGEVRRKPGVPGAWLVATSFQLDGLQGEANLSPAAMAWLEPFWDSDFPEFEMTKPMDPSRAPFVLPAYLSGELELQVEMERTGRLTLVNAATEDYLRDCQIQLVWPEAPTGLVPDYVFEGPSLYVEHTFAAKRELLNNNQEFINEQIQQSLFERLINLEIQGLLPSDNQEATIEALGTPAWTLDPYLVENPEDVQWELPLAIRFDYLQCQLFIHKSNWFSMTEEEQSNYSLDDLNWNKHTVLASLSWEAKVTAKVVIDFGLDEDDQLTLEGIWMDEDPEVELFPPEPC